MVTLFDDLTAVVGADHVLADALDRYLYGKDAGVYRGEVTVIVMPETTAEVAEIVRVAERHGVAVIARGAGTGLAGGAVPLDGGIVVSTTRMNRIFDVDPDNRTAWVGPGVVNLDLSRHTAPLGLHFAPDPSSQAACTIGGNVANNSGGPHCLAEGSTVNHVLALEVVLAGGEVVTVGSAAPDPAGLDLRGIVVGSGGDPRDRYQGSRPAHPRPTGGRRRCSPPSTPLKRRPGRCRRSSPPASCPPPSR